MYISGISYTVYVYSVVLYDRDHGGSGFLAPKYHPKASYIYNACIYFVTSRQFWLGIAMQAQKCVQTNHKPFHQCDIYEIGDMKFFLKILV